MSIRRMDPYRMAMLLFISSEFFFFGSLIVAYLVYRGRQGSEGAALLNVPLTALFSVALFTSSGTMALAERQLGRDNRRGLRLWLLTTAGLGAVFLAGQGYEYAQLMREGFDLSAGAFGSGFYLLTGFHGLHVLAGVVLLLVLWAVARSPRFGHAKGGSAVSAASVYWHFVDAVWVLIFSLVYLWRPG